MPGMTATVGEGRAQNNGAGAGIALNFGWPTERWVAVVVLTVLGLLILLRFGFRGVGFQGNVGARISA